MEKTVEVRLMLVKLSKDLMANYGKKYPIHIAIQSPKTQRWAVLREIGNEEVFTFIMNHMKKRVRKQKEVHIFKVEIGLDIITKIYQSCNLHFNLCHVISSIFQDKKYAYRRIYFHQIEKNEVETITELDPIFITENDRSLLENCRWMNAKTQEFVNIVM